MVRTLGAALCGMILGCGLMAATPATLQGETPTTVPTTAPAGDVASLAQSTVDKGLDYLKSIQQPDSGWQSESDPPAITALVLTAFVQDSKYDADMPFLDKGYDHLLSFQLQNGGIYKDLLANYNTAVAVMALAAAKEPEYKEPLDKAVKYLRSLQWGDSIAGVRMAGVTVPATQPGDHDLSVPTSDPKYGGFGYGKRERPDLSNLQMALDALHDAGVKPSDPTFAAAVQFVTHVQNNSETNNQPWAGNDGGFIYTAADGGTSSAGDYTGPGGKTMHRSYGSMTYAGLKSMLYAGLSKDDPRVKSAIDWIRHDWTWDENPGLAAAEAGVPPAGLYYYFHTASRALRAYGEPVITDAHGVKHDWRVEMIQKIASLQKPDGSWLGQRRFMENKATIASSMAILSLQEAQADLKEHPVQP